MRVSIVGAGSVGGYFGARLAEAGGDVTLLARPRRAETLQRAGLQLASPLGSWSGKVGVVTAEALHGRFDLVVVACKAYDLTSALTDIRPAVGAGTALLPFLNGAAHLDLMAETLPRAELWGGVAHLGVTLAPDGTIRHLNTFDQFTFGPLPPSAVPDRAYGLQRHLEGVPITARAEPDIRQAMWDKLVFLATLAGASCLRRADIGAIAATGTGARVVETLLAEYRAVAAAEGFAPAAAKMEAYHAQLTDAGSRATASMLRDISAGGRTEGDHVLGDLCRRARRHEVLAPMLELCLAHLQTYDIMRERDFDD